MSERERHHDHDSPDVRHELACIIQQQEQNRCFLEVLIKQGEKLMITVQDVKASILKVKADIVAEKKEIQGKLNALGKDIKDLKDQLAKGNAVSDADLTDLNDSVKEIDTGVQNISEPDATGVPLERTDAEKAVDAQREKDGLPKYTDDEIRAQRGEIPVPPSATPINVSAKAGKNYVVVTWDKQDDDSHGFQIERAETNTDFFSEIGVTGPNVYEYRDDSVKVTSVYFYRVKRNKSEYSNIADVMVTGEGSVDPVDPNAIVRTDAELEADRARVAAGFPKYTDAEITAQRLAAAAGAPPPTVTRTADELAADDQRVKDGLPAYTDAEVLDRRKNGETKPVFAKRRL